VKPFGREPLDLGIGVEKGAIDSVRCGAEDAVKSDSVWHGLFTLFVVFAFINWQSFAVQ